MASAARFSRAHSGDVRFPQHFFVPSVKPAKSAVNLSRDYALRKAEELLKADSRAQDVQLVFQERCVRVRGVPVFTQAKHDLKGSFRAPFSDLAIP